MISTRNALLRRTLSLTLLFAAIGFVAFAVAPFSTLRATDAKNTRAAGATAQTPVQDDTPELAAFRQAVGGSITPLIVELKGQPAVLRKLAAERDGEALGIDQIAGYGQELAVEQDTFLASLAGRGVRAMMRAKDVTQVDGSTRYVQYRFTYLLNGFVAYVATEDVDKLRSLPEVAGVSEPEVFEYHLNRAVDYSLGTQPNPADRRTAVYGANQEFQPVGSPGHPEAPATTKLDGFEGQGMNIAIIDSGVDYRHPMFGGTGLNTPFPRVSGRPESADDNKKVIYFYAFNEPVGDPTDDFGHGTLVASNAAGYRVDGQTTPRTGYGLGFDGRGVGPTPNGVELFGTAPQARIMAYKVCGPAPNCLGDIPLSVEDAASPFTLVASRTTAPTPVPKPVADVINLSLGSTSGDAASATSRACNNAALAGVVVVASAGNSGVPGDPGDGTIGAPGSATLAIGVAASLDPGSIAGADVLAPDQIPLETRAPAPGPSPEEGATSNQNAPQPGERQGIRIFPVAGGGALPSEQNPGNPALNSGSISAHYVFVDRTNSTNTLPTTATNRIAVVRSGPIAPGQGSPFATTANQVATLNPAAILIITSTESATAVVVAGEIPTFTIGPDNAKYLLNLLAEGDDDTKDPANGAISRLPLRLAESISLPAFQGSMAGFSSRGPNDHPNARFRTVKPDVTGPGVGIVGAATVEGIPDEAVGLASTTGYTIANGTSFSGPITAGAMVLVRQRVREELGLDTADLNDPDYRTKRFDTVTVARALLQNTATNLRNGFGEPQPDGAGSVAAINDMGSGHINVAGALRAKAVMVSPTLLLPDANPDTAGNQAEFSPPQASPAPTPFPVLLPTASFGTVPVLNLPGTLERRREVILRDVTNGQGDGAYSLTVQNSRGADVPGFEVSFVAPNGSRINGLNVPTGGQRSFFVRVVADGRQITADPSCPTIDSTAACADFQFYVTATSASGDKLRMPFYYRAVAADPNAIPPLAAQLQNISTRVNVQTGDNVGIAGIIITGNEPKRVALRGIGPSLSSDGTPVNGRLGDTVLELFDANGTFITSNDDWKESQQEAIEDSGFAPDDERESVILRTLVPGNYTAVLSGKNGSTGIGLVEAYDRDQTGAGRLANISTRGRVETGDNVLIGGFIAGRQDGPTNIVVRALGPSLVARGVPQALQDPVVQLVNANGEVINENDDFATSPQQNEVQSRGLAPEDPREAALFQVVQPGNYTAVVRGKLDTTGVGLVEVYNVQ
jgi:hypothetical protein